MKYSIGKLIIWINFTFLNFAGWGKAECPRKRENHDQKAPEEVAGPARRIHSTSSPSLLDRLANKREKRSCGGDAFDVLVLVGSGFGILAFDDVQRPLHSLEGQFN